MASAGQVQTSFDNTCVPIKYRCTVGDKYIDPCNCTYYYLCARSDDIISQKCPDGTGFKHDEHGTCPNLNDLVIDGLCEQEKPWKRCSDVEDYDDVNEHALEQRCTSGGGGGGDGGDGGGGGGVDGGLIAGVIIAVLIVAVIVVALIIYVRKRGNPVRHLKESRVWRSMTHKNTGGGQSTAGQTSAPRYADGPGDEETYAEIADTALYKDPSGWKPQTHTQLSHTNETYDKEDAEEGVAYDNPALQRDDTLSPPLPPLPPDEDPPTYSPLEEREQAVRSYSSLNEHKAATGAASRDSKELITCDDGYLMAQTVGGSPRSSSPVDPNYFVLEKS